MATSSTTAQQEAAQRAALYGKKTGSDAVAYLDQTPWTKRDWLSGVYNFGESNRKNTGYEVKFTDSKGKEQTTYGNTPSGYGFKRTSNASEFFRRSGFDSNKLSVNLDRYMGNKAPDESGDWRIAEVIPGSPGEPAHGPKFHGQSFFPAQGATQASYIWTRTTPKTPEEPPKQDPPPAYNPTPPPDDAAGGKSWNDFITAYGQGSGSNGSTGAGSGSSSSGNTSTTTTDSSDLYGAISNKGQEYQRRFGGFIDYAGNQAARQTYETATAGLNALSRLRAKPAKLDDPLSSDNAKKISDFLSRIKF